MKEKNPDGLKTRPLVQRVGNWVMGIGFAMLLTGIWVAKPHVHPVLIAVVFILLALVLTEFFRWSAFDRPAELHRKFPISSKELRRRTREFFDSLNNRRSRPPF